MRFEYRYILVVSVLLMAMLFSGCATRFEKALQGVNTFSEAVYQFGQPLVTQVLADGREQHEWSFDEQKNVPGRWVTTERFVRMDCEDFPVFEEETKFVPEHTVEYRCTLTLVSDQTGKIVEQHWEGNACDRLLLQ